MGRERLLKPTRSSVLLNFENVECDALAFDAAMRAGNSSAKHIPALRRAVALYRGTLLPGCHEPWAVRERETRAQQFVEALRVLTLDAASSGDYAAAEGYLRQAVAANPLKEDARCDLMQWLASRGEHNAALKVYCDLTDLLRADPRSHPGRHITDLYHALRGRSREHNGFPAGDTPICPASGDFPCPLSNLVGREDALREVGARLLLRRLVTLTGPPGVGKTQLALHAVLAAAPGFHDGAWFLDLTQADTRRDIARKLIALLDIRVGPHTEEEALAAFLKPKQALLALDNCEHALQACVPLARSLLSQCSRLRILAISRQPLDITGESLYHVAPLSTPDSELLARSREVLAARLPDFSSAQLFLERARDVNPALTLTTENARHIAALCAKTAGLPLALEMIAAWSDQFTVQEMVQRLSHPLTALCNERADAPPRHASLAAAIQFSYALLPPSLQRAFARLSIFQGGWTYEDAAFVFNGTVTRSELKQLQQRSLIVALDAGETRRFGFLEPVWEFAHTLVPDRERAALAQSHAACFLRLAEEAEPHLRGAAQGEWLRRLEQEYANLQAALTRTREAQDMDTGLRMATALGRFWQTRARYQEGLEWLETLLDTGEKRMDSARLKALQTAGNLAFLKGDHAKAEHFFTQMAQLAQTLQDVPGMASAEGSLGNVAQKEGDTHRARSCFERCLSLFQEMGDKRKVALTLGNLAGLACQEGDFAQAARRHEESLEIFTQEEDRLCIVMALNNLADVKLFLGEDAAAAQLVAQSLALSQEIDSKRTLVHSLSLVICLAVKQEQMQRAAVLMGATQALRDSINVPVPIQAQALWEAQRNRAESELGAQAYLKAVARGGSLALDEVVAFARQD